MTTAHLNCSISLKNPFMVPAACASANNVRPVEVQNVTRRNMGQQENQKLRRSQKPGRGACSLRIKSCNSLGLAAGCDEILWIDGSKQSVIISTVVSSPCAFTSSSALICALQNCEKWLMSLLCSLEHGITMASASCQCVLLARHDKWDAQVMSRQVRKHRTGLYVWKIPEQRELANPTL